MLQRTPIETRHYKESETAEFLPFVYLLVQGHFLAVISFEAVTVSFGMHRSLQTEFVNNNWSQ